jgi:endoglucanase
MIMHTRFTGSAPILLVVFFSTTPLFAAPQNLSCFQRGVAIHNMMNWAAVEQSDPSRYVSPAFRGPNYEISNALLQNVSDAGFDFIRLTVDPGPFLQFSGTQRDALDQHLIGIVERLLTNGFCVIVDFHPTTQVKAYAPDKLVQAIDDPLFLDYLEVLTRTARLLTTLRTDRVALEPMNEPQYGWDSASTERWQLMLEALHSRIRAVAPNLRIILTGARGGDAKGLIAVNPEPFAGSRVFYSFHYYEPHIFTHQGVKSTQPSAWHWQFVFGLPYPAQNADPKRVWDNIERNIINNNALGPTDKHRALKDVRERVSDYFADGFSRAQIAADFDAVLRWTQQSRIDPHSILLGEFGVTRTYGVYRASNPNAQEAWMHDVGVEAEHRGFRWALWALSGYGGMALVARDGGETLDPVSLRALGLRGGN